MGWTECPDWKSRQDAIDGYTDEMRYMGYSTQVSGNWILLSKDGVPVDVVYLIVQKCMGSYGWKEITLTMGPHKYNAPLHMVKQVHKYIKDNEYYQGWLKKYPKRSEVAA
jgi:hypothetical protein